MISFFKMIVVLFLIKLGSSKAHEWEVLSCEGGKDTLINDTQLVKIKKLPALDALLSIKTSKNSLYIQVDKKEYFKIKAESFLTMKNTNTSGEEMWEYSLKYGGVYLVATIKNIKLKIPQFFNFDVNVGEFFVEHNKETKVTEFSVFKEKQMIQIDSDDRVIEIQENQKTVFYPEYQDGDLVYDFLLNHRKIPKLKMLKEDGKNNEKMWDLINWGLCPKNKKNNLLVSSKSFKNLNINKSDNGGDTSTLKKKFICKKPKGKYGDCYYQSHGKSCWRYFCNASGEWSQKTQFPFEKMCPLKPEINSCQWLKE